MAIGRFIAGKAMVMTGQYQAFGWQVLGSPDKLLSLNRLMFYSDSLLRHIFSDFWTTNIGTKTGLDGII